MLREVRVRGVATGLVDNMRLTFPAEQKTEAMVQQRTGHTSSIMINRYRRMAMTAEELGLGPLLPMHRGIPELARLGGDEPIPAGKSATEADILVVNFNRG